jgi:hypothetical protein
MGGEQKFAPGVIEYGAASVLFHSPLDVDDF